MTAADLAGLRSRTPGCEIVALVDVTTQTILAADYSLWRPQEDLDLLGRRAAEVLPDPVGGALDMVCTVSAQGVTSVLPLPGAPGEALVAEMAPWSDPTVFLAVAREIMAGDVLGDG